MQTSTTFREIHEPAVRTDDAELQRLNQEHSEYEEQLQQLSRSRYLSSEAILLKAELKKMKLRVKDEIQRRLAGSYRPA